MYSHKIISKNGKNRDVKNKWCYGDSSHYSSDESYNSNSITRTNNHIYFYCDVNTETILELNKNIMTINNEIKSNIFNFEKNNDDMEFNIKNFNIYLHINSGGGYITDALAGVDAILNSNIPITSIIEGHAASAATFLSIVCHKRIITKHSSMLIHQLSGGYWGTYEQMTDDYKNSTYLQKIIKKLYIEYSKGKLTNEKLDKYLKRDLYWSAKKCKKLCLVDEIR